MFTLKHKLMNEAGVDGVADGGGGEQPTVEQLQAQMSELTSQFEKVTAKNQELLGETKAAKSKLKEFQTEAAEQAAMESGNYEQLFKSAEERNKSLADELESMKLGLANKERDTTAIKLAGELADGYNAELLAEQIAKRLKYTEEGVKIVDSNGNLTVSTLDELKAEFKSSERFASLIRGNQSSGGSATGGKSSGATGKVMTRAEFDAMMPAKKMEFIKSGGKTVD
jgi:chromosome segregation ATPase